MRDANKIEAQLRQEGQTLLALAENSDRAAPPDGTGVPPEIARRDDPIERDHAGQGQD